MVKAALKIYCLFITLFAFSMTATAVILSRNAESVDAKIARWSDCGIVRFTVKDIRDCDVEIRFYKEPLDNGGYVINAITEEDRKYNNGSCHGVTIFRENELLPKVEPTPAKR